MKEEGQKERRKALIISGILYLLFALVFLFVGLKYPDPPLEETGIEIAMADFGYDDSGSGEVEPSMSSAPQEVSNASEEVVEEEVVDPIDDEIVSDDNSDISVPAAQENTQSETQSEQVVEEQQQVEEVVEEPVIDEKLQNVLGAWNETATSESEGSSDVGGGNEGIESGNPSGKGTFGGNGSSFELGGRSLLSGPSIGEKPTEEGKVVLNIWVGRDGSIIRTSPNIAESTTTSTYLFSLAEKAAKKAKFNASESSAPQQRGKMTFIFILR